MNPPQRSCCACRETADRGELVRLVRLEDGTVAVDYRAKAPGRGAWVHPSAECIGTLERRPQVLSRALKGQVDPGDLGGGIRTAVVHAAGDGLSQAAASGALVGGHDVLVRALEEGRVVEVAVASDAAERTLRSLRAAAGAAIAFTEVPWSRAELGGRIGRGPRAAVGVTRSRSAAHLIRQLRRLRMLG